jgi:hypothetical protein
MPTPNDPATARIALEVIRDVRTFINTFHCARSDNAPLNLGDLQNMNAVFADWWLNSYRHAVKANIVGSSITATKQDPANPIQDTVFLAAPGDYASGVVQPGDVTAAVSWRTGLAGRKYRGRFYDFGVPSDAFQVNDAMTGSYITLLTSVGNYLLTHLAAASLKPVIFHRASNTHTTITGLVVDQLLDAMRRRLASRGI